MKPRKLLARDLLELIWLRYSVGVPVRKLHRDFKLNMSLPLIGNLIEYYEDSTDIEQSVHITNTIHASLFPEWLKEDSKLVQTQPKNWKYIGKFPLGSWRKNENN